MHLDDADGSGAATELSRELTRELDFCQRQTYYLRMATFAGSNSSEASIRSMMQSLKRLRSCCERLMSGVRAQASVGEAECAFLEAFPREATITSGELCRAVGISPSRGSRVIETLVQKGMVRRLPDATDRRVSLVELTDSGRDLKVNFEACMARCEEALATRLSPEEYLSVEVGLAHLLRVMDELHGVEKEFQLRGIEL